MRVQAFVNHHTEMRLPCIRLAFSLWLVACGGSESRASLPVEPPAVEVPATNPEPGASTNPTRPQFAHTIPNREVWQSLMVQPATATLAHTEVVKFLVDLHNERQIYFVDTARYDIHYYFARDELSAHERVLPHETFNIVEYRRPERRFEMGSLVHYADGDHWTLELVAGDTLSGERIAHLFQEIRAQVFFGARLRFRSISPAHDAALRDVQGQIPVIETQEVFSGMRYEPLTLGVAFGYLRIVRDALDLASVRPDQILVLAHLPDEVPVSAAVVSSELQAPLGHIALLCSNRRTPNMALVAAVEDTRLLTLEGQLVRLEIGAQDFNVRTANQREADEAWASRRPRMPLMLALRPNEREIRPMHQLRLSDASAYGAKAAQLGETTSIPNAHVDLHTPGGFAIPFGYYLDHFVSSHASEVFRERLIHTTPPPDMLQRMRALIEAQPVDERLVQQVRDRMMRIAPMSRWILRSSTNAEDLPGFTGAGLYRSIVIGPFVRRTANSTRHAEANAEIARALREVWASVWLDGAFQEREWYRVDQGSVAMGVLAQPFVDGAQVNGVALTCNPFFEGRPGYFVNAQVLGGSVTGAGGGEVPEQHLIYTYMESLEMEQLSRSSRSTAPLLNQVDLQSLARSMTSLHQHFLPRWPGSNGVDLEFLIAGPERNVVILQARPYTCVYSEDQRWQ